MLFRPALGLPYRGVDIAVSDLGASAARKFDCEAWLPSQERYRELTSCSNTTDYQARRLDVRVRPASGKPEPLATLDGTAVAGRRTAQTGPQPPRHPGARGRRSGRG